MIEVGRTVLRSGVRALVMNRAAPKKYMIALSQLHFLNPSLFTQMTHTHICM